MILITGGAGYIGSHMHLYLLNTKIDHVVLDNLSHGFIENIDSKFVNKGNFYQGSIQDSKLVSEIIKKHKITSVIHFAAFVSVGESVKNPEKYFLNNFENAKIFFDTCVANNVENFIFSSTAAVYGNATKELINENHATDPQSPYADSKLKFENYLRQRKSNTKISILRYFNVAGASSTGALGQRTKGATHLIKIICENLTGKRKEIQVYGNDYATSDGTGVRDYIHVDDLVDAHYCVLNKMKNSQENYFLYNCGYGKGSSVLEVIQTFEKISDQKVNYQIIARRSGDVESVIADSSKLIKETNWKPKYADLKIICKSALEWERKI